MAAYTMSVVMVEQTEYHLEIEAGSMEEAEELAREMWDDGSWLDSAVEDEYYNGDSGYEVGEAGDE